MAILLMLIAGCSRPAPSSDAGADAGAPDGGLDGGEMARAHVPAPFAPTPETIAYCRGDDVAIEARITELLARMTLSQKLAMMSGAPFAEGVWPVGGDDALGIPGLHMLDGPRGLSAFSGKRGTAFPVAMLRGATWDPELERRVGRAMAREIRSAGADVLLAPTINLLRHPRWGRAQETYGEDVCHMGQMGVAFIDGVQSENVIASVKHYAANSIEDTRHTVDVELDERTLREIYLPHFRRAVVDARAGSVMSAYNSVNGSFCDLNRYLLTDILRDEWGFAGFVESDWFAGTHGDAESVLAGLDIEMPFPSRFRALPRAIREGRLTEHDIDRSVRRILRAQFCFGLDARERVLDDPGARETPEHLALALEVAQRGIVLLRNEGGALPLDRSAIAEVAVLGRNAGAESIGDMGSSSVRPTDVVTALEGLRDRAASGPSAVTITHVPDDGGALDAAGRAAVARAGAVVIVTGLRSEDEGEGEIAGGDRESLDLPAQEVALIREVAPLTSRLIVVLQAGAAIIVADWQDEVEALLFAFYPGQEGGHALADVLFGAVAPSGRLPFSMPAREEDLPPFDNLSARVTYGYFHGYRHLDHEGIAPAYPFGHGLGYTRFTYASLVLESASLDASGTLRARVDVTNAGTVPGRETVQLYIGAQGSRVTRSQRDLRAFTQVELAAGETRTVALEVPIAELAFWDEAASAWEVEPITYRVEVGASAGDLPLGASFDVR